MKYEYLLLTFCTDWQLEKKESELKIQFLKDMLMESWLNEETKVDGVWRHQVWGRYCDNMVKSSLRQCNSNKGRLKHSKSREEFHQGPR